MNSPRQIVLFLAALAGVLLLVWAISEGKVVPSWPGPALGGVLARKLGGLYVDAGR